MILGEGMVPLQVRAHLAGGVAQAAPWGIALDGLLASELWADQKARMRAAGRDYARAMEIASPPDLDLPLARCVPDNGPWHWAATCARPDQNPDRIDVHTWTGRVDHRSLEQTADRLPKIISARQGRYRSRRMPLLVTPCASVTWYAIGYVAKIEDLLAQVLSIGKKRATGEGHVLRWEITARPDLDPIAAAHLHDDGTLGRTMPDSCRSTVARITRRPAEGGGRAGIRPPYMHPSRNTTSISRHSSNPDPWHPTTSLRRWPGPGSTCASCRHSVTLAGTST